MCMYVYCPGLACRPGLEGSHTHTHTHLPWFGMPTAQYLHVRSLRGFPRSTRMSGTCMFGILEDFRAVHACSEPTGISVQYPHVRSLGGFPRSTCMSGAVEYMYNTSTCMSGAYRDFRAVLTTHNTARKAQDGPNTL